MFVNLARMCVAGELDSSGHFTGIMIGTTCGIIFIVLSALAVFHTRKMRLRRAQTWRSDGTSTLSLDVHQANAPPSYETGQQFPFFTQTLSLLPL